MGGGVGFEGKWNLGVGVKKKRRGKKGIEGKTKNLAKTSYICRKRRKYVS